VDRKRVTDPRPFGIGLLLLLAGPLLCAQPVPSKKPSSQQVSPQQALINQYCVTCHNQRAKTAGLLLDKLDIHRAGEHADVWEKVVRKLRGGMMPPQGMPRPDQAQIDGLIAWLQTSLDRAEAARPDPGRAPLHRLNRTEYANAIRDLLGLKVDVTALLPADDESNGFDNIAEVLRVSPSLLEAYLSASREVSSLALGDPKIGPISESIQVPPDMSQDGHIEGLPLGTRGGILIHHNFPLDADYEFNVFLLRNIVGYLTGMEFPHQLEVSIDGERVFLAPVGGEEDLKLVDTNLAQAGDTLDARLRTKVHVKAGPHDVAVSFLRRDSAESDEPLEPFTRDLDLQNMNGIPLIDHVQITGPMNATGPGDTPSRRRIFVCNPASSKDEVSCARQILSTLARRAYRRPVTDADMETLLSFYQAGRNQGGNFEAGIENSLRLILASPKFLFRSEPDPARVVPGSIYHVSDLELASRLSFFLWSSIPDDELLNVAAEGKLKDPEVLDREVRRMLADPKAVALVNNFAEQWLFLRNVQSVAPDEATFPDFDDNLRQSFRRETELFFGSIVKEDRDVMDLLTANYTFVNERLAKHYGIPNVYGSQFRKVTLTNDTRRGLLGQGSILSVTSVPTRTSPVIRGKWIMENLMGTPPPAPPPNVPALKDQAQGGKILSVRQLLEEHRKNAPCSTCHAVMDPLGFALENFNAVGEYRAKDASGPIDSSGQLADGTKIDGVVGLRQALLKHPEYFVGTLTEKMLTYALGRPLEYYDMPVVRGIVQGAAKNDYRFSSLIAGIVKSEPFEMKKALVDSGPAVTTSAVRQSDVQGSVKEGR
jgi:mono/diheme cytochrome c family protein